MSERKTLSAKTRINWLIDATVFIGALLAALSGIYFLFLPSGGYQGGRNPMYGVEFLFDRRTWDDLHTWGGVLMIAAVAVHIAIHWWWIVAMTKRIFTRIFSRGTCASIGATRNLIINGVIGLSFLLTTLSGIYFLFAPTGGFRGGSSPGWDPGFLFSRVTWDLIHTWAGVVLIGAALIHFTIHWRWIANVTARFFIWPGRRTDPRREPVMQQTATDTRAWFNNTQS